jgi:hypothetical protein
VEKTHSSTGRRREQAGIRLAQRVVLVELGFFFGRQRVHQKDTVAPPGFGMAAMRADHIVRIIRIGLFPREFVYLERTPALEVGTSLEQHGQGAKYIWTIYFIAVSSAQSRVIAK